jgi:hypothetical protein
MRTIAVVVLMTGRRGCLFALLSVLVLGLSTPFLSFDELFINQNEFTPFAPPVEYHHHLQPQ